MEEKDIVFSAYSRKLLRELKKQGKPNRDVVNRYFQTQKEADYLKDYNWSIIRDYVDDVNAPQIKYLFKNQSKFMQNFSKDDVFQKLDNVFVGHLEQYYNSNKIEYNKYLDFLKSSGYEHYDVVADYFYIKQLRAERKSEDYFYKARKLFRYFDHRRWCADRRHGVRGAEQCGQPEIEFYYRFK